MKSSFLYPVSFRHLRSKVLTGGLALGLLVGAGNSPAAILVNETFSDGNITSGAPAGTINPESLAWYGTSSSDPNVGFANGALRVYASTGGARQATAHFMPQGQAMTLGVGETLSMSFNFTAKGGLGAGTGNLMRFGLFSTNNDPGSYIENNRSTASLKFDGYTVAVHNDAFEGNSEIVRAHIMVRDHLKGVTSATGVNSGHLLSNSSAFYNPATDSLSQYTTDINSLGKLAIETLYTGQLTLTRVNETTMRVSSSITGGGMNVQDEYLHVGQDHDFANAANLKVGRSNFTFDTLAFTYNWAGGNGMQEISIDNILVSHVVPEPGRATLFGLAALMVFARRKRHAK